jgi:hypothetical protein
MMDVLQELRQAHDKAKSMFMEIERANPDQRGALWDKLRPELTAHEQYEERFVYGPVAKDADGREPDLTTWDERHHAQVRTMSTLIDDVGQLDASSDRWLVTLRDLQSSLEQHIDQEEGEIFPKIAVVWDANRRAQVGDQVAAKKAAGAASGVSGAVGKVGEAIKDAAQKVTGS